MYQKWSKICICICIESSSLYARKKYTHPHVTLPVAGVALIYSVGITSILLPLWLLHRGCRSPIMDLGQLWEWTLVRWTMQPLVQIEPGRPCFRLKPLTGAWLKFRQIHTHMHFHVYIQIFRQIHIHRSWSWPWFYWPKHWKCTQQAQHTKKWHCNIHCTVSSWMKTYDEARVCTGLKFELSPARQKIFQNPAQLAYESPSEARIPARLTVRMLHEFLFIPSPVLPRTVM